MKKYKILEDTNIYSLASMVDKKLSEDWELVGGICFAHRIGLSDRYLQAMIKNDDVDSSDRK